MDVIKILLALSDFATPCFWLLTLKDCLWARLLRFATTDLWMRGLLTLREQSDLPTLNGLVWWLTLFMIWTFRLRTCLTCWLILLTLLILFLLRIVEQTGLLTVNGSTSLLTLLRIQTFWLLILLEHTALTGLHRYKCFTISLTLYETTILAAVTCY